MRLKPQHANIPWSVSFEFPSHADAKAFATLMEEQFGDKAIVRKKNAVFNQGALVNWRSTRVIREALAGRSFDSAMVGEVLTNSGYAGSGASAVSWLGRATAEGIIVRLERGIYEFQRAQPAPPKCAACQPEPLRCTAL